MGQCAALKYFNLSDNLDDSCEADRVKEELQPVWGLGLREASALVLEGTDSEESIGSNIKNKE